MIPIPAHQRHLFISFSAGTLGTPPDPSDKNPFEVWLLHREDAHDWLEARRPFFPKASSQELVSMAILPEDFREDLAALFCGLASGSPAVDLAFCSKPDFAVLTQTSAVCRIQGLAMGRKVKPKIFNSALIAFERQLALAMPTALKMPQGFFSNLDNPDAEARALAFWDQRALDKIPVGSKPLRNRPGL